MPNPGKVTQSRIYKLYDHRCAGCGVASCKSKGRSNLDIHHIDQNRSNNAYWNLILVCRKCHKRIHCTGILPTDQETYEAAWQGWRGDYDEYRRGILEQAHSLLQQGMSINAIAKELNYSSNYLSRLYFKYFGVEMGIAKKKVLDIQS